MSNPLWTDERLDVWRRVGDSVNRWDGRTFDSRIPLILEGPPLHEAISVLTDWLETQKRNIETTREIARTLTPVESGSVPPGAAKEPNPAIEQLIKAQNPQNDVIGQLSIGFLPDGTTELLDNARLVSVIVNYSLQNQNLDQAIAAMAWASVHMAQLREQLQKIKQDSDPQDPVNPVNSDYLDRYNRFLKGVDSIRENPSLLLAPEAFRTEVFNAYPARFRGPFEAAPCPRWLDEPTLRAGLQLWEKNSVGILLVAFAHSLPACYLDKKGIPTLYQSERLLKQEFLAQRIYETAFFLSDVMQNDGFYIINEAGGDLAWLAAAVHQAHPDWRFSLSRHLRAEWTDGHNTFGQADVMELPEVERAYQTLKQTGGWPEDFSAADLGVASFPWLHRKIVRNTLRPPSSAFGRFLWGPGFLAAVKVRYFHAQMRFFVENAARRRGATLPDTPINQEDLAYTLLTFGYVIPLGLEKLGCMLTPEDKHGFLHLWRLVGHLMGIGDDLLTDDWDQAKELYEKIKSRQQARSDNGVKLTNALCTFVADLLPTWLPFRGAIAPVLIRDQMGADADHLFDAERKAASRNLVVRGCWALVKHVPLRCYFLSRYLVFDRIGITRGAKDSDLSTNDCDLQFMGRALIDSWRQSYDRLPFDFTPGATGFGPAIPDGSRAETKTEQPQGAVYRRKVSGWVAVGLGLIVLFHVLSWIGIAGFIALRFSSAVWLRWALTATFWLWVADVIGVGLVERRLQHLRNPANVPQPQL